MQAVVEEEFQSNAEKKKDFLNLNPTKKVSLKIT